MNHEHEQELRCTFEDAERSNLLAGVHMSTRAKVELFEEMLDFAWRAGAIKASSAKDINANERLPNHGNISKQSE